MKSIHARCLKQISVFTAAFLLTLFAGYLFSLEVPALKGRVNDLAEMLSPSSERTLEQTLKQFEQTESTQIVVLTIPSLRGDSLEEFSIRMAEQWKIGRKELDSGAILLVARADRKLRIEVGFGLEGRLTDAMSGRIIRNIIVPEFRAGRFQQGIVNGVHAMMDAVRGEFKDVIVKKPRPAPGAGFNSAIIYFIVFVVLIGQLGRIRRWLGTLAGGMLLPAFAVAAFSFSPLIILALFPVGLIFGLIVSMVFFKVSGGVYPGGFYSGGGRYGGFSGSGGGISFGGFSGGGGGFGGGGASGSW
jgi:uncharacterized protein